MIEILEARSRFHVLRSEFICKILDEDFGSGLTRRLQLTEMRFVGMGSEYQNCIPRPDTRLTRCSLSLSVRIKKTHYTRL